MFTIDHYLALVPSWNQGHPKFMATLAAVLQPFADAQEFLADLPLAFDIDSAIGVQLDATGQWVNQSRYIPVPLANIWFSFDIANKGFDQGVWKGPYDTGFAISSLDDNTYRRLLKAIVIANQWDGSIAMAMSAFDEFFDDPSVLTFIQDNSDLSCVFGISGHVPSLLDIWLLYNNYIPFKPEGIKTYYLVTSVDRTPMFGFDMGNDYINGFDSGSFGVDPEQIIEGNVSIGAAQGISPVVTNLTSGLVGWWTFTPGTINWATNTITDQSGNGNDGTLVGLTSANLTAGIVGEALSFNGSTQYISVPDAASLNPNAISVSCWIQPETTLGGDFWSKNDNNGLRCRLNNDPVVELLNAGAANVVNTGSVAALGTWLHVVATADSSGLTLYINGVLNVQNNVPYINGTFGAPLLIGANVTFDEFFSGNICDMRVYNRVLSQAEVTRLYQLQYQ